MKKGIHPEYVEAHVRCTCGNEFTTRSTKPELHVEICSECHPFYTGKQKLVDTGGRVERFQRRAAKRQSLRQLSRTSLPTTMGDPGGIPGRLMSADPTTPATDRQRRPEPSVRGEAADGRLMPAKDAPIGGQAVLEGVMMRGVSHLGGRGARARTSSPPERASANGAANGDHHLVEEAEVALEAAATTVAGVGPASGNGAVGADGDEPLGADRGPPRVLRVRDEAAAALPAADRARRGGAVESLKIGMKALGISANAQLDEPDEEIVGQDLGLHDLPVARVRDRPLLRPAGHRRELLEGRRRQLGRASWCSRS